MFSLGFAPLMKSLAVSNLSQGEGDEFVEFKLALCLYRLPSR